MKELDGLAFLLPAAMFAAGVLVSVTGEWMVMVASTIGVVGALTALYTGWLSLRVVMDFADDGGIRHGWRYAAQFLLRGASAMWLWFALALLILGLIYGDSRGMLHRASGLAAFLGGAVFVIGMAWLVIYARAKHNVHAPRPRE